MLFDGLSWISPVPDRFVVVLRQVERKQEGEVGIKNRHDIGHVCRMHVNYVFDERTVRSSCVAKDYAGTKIGTKFPDFAAVRIRLQRNNRAPWCVADVRPRVLQAEAQQSASEKKQCAGPHVKKTHRRQVLPIIHVVVRQKRHGGRSIGHLTAGSGPGRLCCAQGHNPEKTAESGQREECRAPASGRVQYSDLDD